MLGNFADKTLEGVVTYLEQFIEVFRNHNHNNDNTPSVDKNQNGIGTLVAANQVCLTEQSEGDLKITCGFRPKMIRFNGWAEGANGGFSWGIGLPDVGGLFQNRTIIHFVGYPNDPYTTGDTTNTYCLRITDAGGATHTYVKVIAIDNDSFTINIDFDGSPSMTHYMFWEAIG